MSQPRVGLPPAELGLRAGAYMLDGLIVGAARLLLRGAGAPWPVPFALAAAYFTWMPLAYQGQTFGKMAAGVAIVDEKGAKLTATHLLIRYAGYFLSAALLGAGYLLALFHPERRALHDVIAGTRVVQVEAVSPARRWLVIGAGLGSFALLAALLGLAVVLALTGR